MALDSQELAARNRRDFSSQPRRKRPVMRGPRFRTTTPTQAVLIQDGPNVAVTVPAGSIVEVVDGPLDSNRLMDVQWDGKIVMMFRHRHSRAARTDRWIRE
jgi:hypothetical protein